MCFMLSGDSCALKMVILLNGWGYEESLPNAIGILKSVHIFETVGYEK